MEYKLNEVSMKIIKINKKCKCRYCHWYRPKEGLRCYGFNEEDVKKCIKNNYGYFSSRKRKSLF